MTDKKLRLYPETTVFNYYFDGDRKEHDDVLKLFEAIQAGEYEGYTSEYVILELKKAPNPKRDSMLALIEQYRLVTLKYIPAALYLAREYIEANVVPGSHLLDSLHIAAASVYELDCVISYNFKHINRDKARRLTAKINNAKGYGGIIICGAGEVLKND